MTGGDTLDKLEVPLDHVFALFWQTNPYLGYTVKQNRSSKPYPRKGVDRKHQSLQYCQHMTSPCDPHAMRVLHCVC